MSPTAPAMQLPCESEDAIAAVRAATTPYIELTPESSRWLFDGGPPREVTLAAAKAAREARALAREAARRDQARTRLVVLGIWSVAMLLAGSLGYLALST